MTAAEILAGIAASVLIGLSVGQLLVLMEALI